MAFAEQLDSNKDADFKKRFGTLKTMWQRETKRTQELQESLLHSSHEAEFFDHRIDNLYVFLHSIGANETAIAELFAHCYVTAFERGIYLDLRQQRGKVEHVFITFSKEVPNKKDDAKEKSKVNLSFLFL